MFIDKAGIVRTIFYFALVSALSRIAHAQVSEFDPPTEPIGEEPQNSARLQTSLNDQLLFKRLFTKRRKEHIDAVQNLRKIDSYERLYKMITVLAETVVNVIGTNRAIVENSGFLQNGDAFPENADTREALSSILENAALFGDIILHIPDITHKILKNQQKFNDTIHWSINFLNQTRHLLDESTLIMLHLVGQELNITTREAGYFNPYSESSQTKISQPEKKKKLKKEKRKGPQITKIEL